MASHEARCGHHVGRADRRATETQVRAGEAPRLLRVVREVSRAIFVDIVINNLHGVLVSTNGNISTHSIRLSMEHASTAEGNLLNLEQRSEGHVVYFLSTASTFLFTLSTNDCNSISCSLSSCGFRYGIKRGATRNFP